MPHDVAQSAGDLPAVLNAFLSAVTAVKRPERRLELLQEVADLFSDAGFREQCGQMDGAPGTAPGIKGFFKGFWQHAMQVMKDVSDEAAPFPRHAGLVRHPAIETDERAADKAARSNAAMNGQLARGLFLVDDPAERLACWQFLRESSGSGCAGQRVALYAGLVDAIALLDDPAHRAAAIDAAMDGIGALPAEVRPPLMRPLVFHIAVMDDKALVERGFNALLELQEQAPDAASCRGLDLAMTLWPQLSEQRLRPALARLMHRLPRLPKAEQARQLVNVACALKRAPHVTPHVFDALWSGARQLDIGRAARPCAAIIRRIKDLPDASRQRRFDDAIDFLRAKGPTSTCLPLLCLVDAIKSLSPTDLQVAAFHDVLRLTLRQDRGEQWLPMKALLNLLPTHEPASVRYSLLRALTGEVSKLHPIEGAELIHLAAEIAITLPSPYMAMQFEGMIAAAQTFDSAACLQALTNMTGCLQHAVAHVSGLDDDVALMRRLKALLATTEVIPDAMRLLILQTMLQSVQSVKPSIRIVARNAILMRVTALPANLCKRCVMPSG